MRRKRLCVCLWKKSAKKPRTGRTSEKVRSAALRLFEVRRKRSQGGLKDERRELAIEGFRRL